MTILDAFPFGSHHFEIGLILRDSLLTSSMLCNSEAWYNVTKNEMELLETVDTTLLRRILNAPKYTAKEMLYLELGCIPYRYLIKKRRLMFLFYILTQDTNSMIYKFFESQKNHQTSKDWVTTITQDMKELNIDKNFEEIKKMKKMEFKKLVTQKIQKWALEKLEEMKNNHSKVKELKHENFGLQKYLKHSNIKIKIEERQLIFQLRSGITNVKMNRKGMYEDLRCDACKEENETQEHVLNCKILNKNENQTIDFKKIRHGNIIDMVEIAKKFKENLEIRDKL